MVEPKQTRHRVLAAAFFWGSIWGLWEATAGHLIHLVRVPGLPGLIMAPAALFFLSRAFLAGGTYKAVFLTGCVAAGMKLLDLFVPGRDIMAAVNPAQFILLETLAVTGYYALLRRKSETHTEFREIRCVSPISERLPRSQG